MDIAVQAASTKWREAVDRVDLMVDRCVDRQPVDPAEWAACEEIEFAARSAYYVLLATRYGLPIPNGLGVGA